MIDLEKVRWFDLLKWAKCIAKNRIVAPSLDSYRKLTINFMDGSFIELSAFHKGDEEWTYDNHLIYVTEPGKVSGHPWSAILSIRIEEK